MNSTDAQKVVSDLFSSSGISIKQDVNGLFRENARRQLNPVNFSSTAPVLKFKKVFGRLDFELSDLEQYAATIIDLENRKRLFKRGK